MTCYKYNATILIVIVVSFIATVLAAPTTDEIPEWLKNSDSYLKIDFRTVTVSTLEQPWPHYYEKCKKLSEMSIFDTVESIFKGAPVKFRYQWNQSKSLNYQCIMDIDVNTNQVKNNNRRIKMKITMPFTLTVLNKYSDEQAKVELRYGKTKTELKANGHKVVIEVSSNHVSGFNNDQPMAYYELKELEESCKDFQNLIAHPISFIVNKTGKIERVSGLDWIDPEDRKNIVTSLVQGMELPSEPISLNDKFVTKRSIVGIFPNSGNKGVPLDEIIDIERKFSKITKEKNALIAEFDANLNKDFNQICIDKENNICVDMGVNMKYSSFFDITHGEITQEKGWGTVTIKELNGSETVVAKVNCQIDLLYISNFLTQNQIKQGR